MIAVTSDGASLNRRLYRIHNEFDDDLILGSICHKTVTDDRYIIFLRDASHLLKTARNCLYNSGYRKKQQVYVERIIWLHIIQVYQQYQEYPIRLVPKDIRSAYLLPFIFSYVCKVCYANSKRVCWESTGTFR